MKENEYSQITSKVKSNFILSLCIQPALFLLFCIPYSDSGIVRLLKVFIIIYPFALCLMSVFFMLKFRKFKDDMAFVFDEKNAGNVPRRIFISLNFFPFKTVVIQWIGFISAVILSVLLFVYYGIYNTVQESVFAGMQGIVTVLIASGIYYTRVRNCMFPVVEHMYVRVLTIFEKIAGPVILSILFLLCCVSAIRYTFVDGIINDLRHREIVESVDKTTLNIEGFVNELYNELHVYSTNPVFREMNVGRMAPVLKEMQQNKRNAFIQLYFACDTTGKGPTSLGQLGDISRLPEFQQCINTGKPLFTNPMKSQITEDLIIIGLYPVLNNGRVVGVVGGTVMMDAILQILAKEKKYATGRFLIVNDKGKIIFSATKSIIGKVIGIDIKDDGKNLKDTGRILTAGDNSFLTYTYNAKPTISYKSTIPALNYNILFSLDKSEFYKESAYLILMESISFFIFAIIAFVVVWIIADGFSKPIRNTIRIFKKLSEGDLTASSNDYLTDEFGLLIRNLKSFILRIRTVIEVSSDASVNLSQSVEELSATSQAISDLSQTQAASIEETSASVEEVAASIDMIATHAREQSDLSKSTYKSMSELQGAGGEVVKFAGDALSISEQTTLKASEGSELMSRTINGMNRIDESTRSIAEMVATISDISDRVGMLALNASIEAARAGDQGRGFAVVAEEVSKLAEETAVTAKKINEVVIVGRNEVRSGMEYVSLTSDAFKSINENIEKTRVSIKNISDSLTKQSEMSGVVLSETGRVMDMAEKISASTAEQLIINQEISKTIDQINRNTQTSASGAEEVASSAEEISAQAAALMEQMKFFKV